MNGYPGKFIVLYGINNLGKSTQAKLLVERLKANGYQAEYLKYPVYELKPSGEILNDYLRLGNAYDLTPREAQIIYALNRDQYQAELIRKLKSGINVIAEDYAGTGIAWGLGAGVSEEFLKAINSHLLGEDLVFLFDGRRFKEAVEDNHRHETDEDLMNKVRWAHLKLKEEYGWLKINANEPIEAIHEEIWQKVHALLSGLPPGQAEKAPAPSSFASVGAIIKSNHQPNLNVEPKVEVIQAPTPDPIEKGSASPKLLAEKIMPEAKLPQIATAGDAGYDLFAADYYSLAPYGQATISTGIKLAIPAGYVGLIWDKSGLANQGIKTMGGVIDSGYRGEIKVLVKNLGEDVFNLVPGQKIAQLIIQPFSALEVEEGSAGSQPSQRGENGFGSTGQF